MIHKLQIHTYVLLYNTYNLDLLFMSTYIKKFRKIYKLDTARAWEKMFRPPILGEGTHPSASLLHTPDACITTISLL